MFSLLIPSTSRVLKESRWTSLSNKPSTVNIYSALPQHQDSSLKPSSLYASSTSMSFSGRWAQRRRLHYCRGRDWLQMVQRERGDAVAEGRGRGGDRHPSGQHDGQQSCHGRPRLIFFLLTEKKEKSYLSNSVMANLVLVSDDLTKCQVSSWR